MLGIIGISANFVLVAMGLHYISPTTTQVLWQLSPFTMIFGGVGVFKEAFTHWQKIGLMLLLMGLATVFQRQIRRTFPALGQLRGRRDDGGFGQHDLGVLRRGAKTFCPNIPIRQQILLMIYFAAALFSCRLPNRRKSPISAIRFYGAALSIAA